MTDHTLEKIFSLGMKLPQVPEPVAAYVNYVKAGNILYLSGGLPIDDTRKIVGKVPSTCSLEEAREGARIIILNRLAIIKEAVESLDNLVQVISLTGFVNSAPDFYDHPQIINGASELLVEILGERGQHSRTALGVAALPLNVAVEINLIVEVSA